MARGSLHRVFLDGSDYLDLQVSFEGAPCGLAWVTQGYEQCDAADRNTVADYPWLREMFDYMAADWVLVPVGRFAGFLPIDADPGRPFRNL